MPSAPWTRDSMWSPVTVPWCVCAAQIPIEGAQRTIGSAARSNRQTPPVRQRTPAGQARCDDRSTQEASMLVRLAVVFSVAFAVLAPVTFA